MTSMSQLTVWSASVMYRFWHLHIKSNRLTQWMFVSVVQFALINIDCGQTLQRQKDQLLSFFRLRKVFIHIIMCDAEVNWAENTKSYVAVVCCRCTTARRGDPENTVHLFILLCFSLLFSPDNCFPLFPFASSKFLPVHYGILGSEF